MSKRRVHSLLVKRQPGGVALDGTLNRGPLVTVYAEVRGLVEPKKSQETLDRTKAVSQACNIFTWFGGETILPGDEVTWLAPVGNGKTYITSELAVDSHRPGSRVSRYQTIDLTQKPTA